MSKIPQEAIELLPCPFCGSEEIYMEPDEYGSGGQWVLPISVGCCVCGVDIGCVDAETEDEAATVWNKRYEAADAARAQGAEVEPVCIECGGKGWVVENQSYGNPYGEQVPCACTERFPTREKMLEEALVELKRIVHDWDGEPEDILHANAVITKIRAFDANTTPPAPQPTDREKVLEEVFAAAVYVLREHRSTYDLHRSDLQARGKANAHFYKALIDVCDSIEEGMRSALAGKAPSQTDRAEGAE